MNERFKQRMQELLKEEFDAYAMCMEQPAVRGVRVNLLRMPNEKPQGIAVRPSPFCKNGWYYEDEKTAGSLTEYITGCLYSQEPSASSAVSALGIEPGMKVLDLCAAPGSKSTQIAEYLGHTGVLVANEYVANRASILKENLERHGAANAIVLNGSVNEIADAFEGWFDAVLCDAPCSGEGMFRKDPNAEAEWSEEAVLSCARRQAEILEAAYRCLKSGGVLVYSTCTFSKEENEDNVIRLLERHTDLSLEPIDGFVGHPGIASAYQTEYCQRIYPMDGGEGHFVARFRKADADETIRDKKRMKSDPMPKEAAAFLKEHLSNQYPYYFVRKGRVYGGLFPFIETGKARLVRHQVLLGSVEKGRFEPSHAMAMSAYAPFQPSLELSEAELQKYRRGETLKHPFAKGWVLLTIHQQPVALARSDGNILKNHYPKAFRIR